MTKGVVLFSGGLDSTTALYWSLNRYEGVEALTFDYGQRHRLEIRMAKILTKKLNLPHTILRVDLNQIGGSSLTDSTIPVPEFIPPEQTKAGPPSTYVPFRNGIFLALAAAWSEVKGIKAIICGFNVIDSPHYPDTREDFARAMERAINQGTKAYFEDNKFQIITPFTSLKKSEIIKQGLALGADYSYSLSCYSGTEIPCRKCSSCVLRQRAWNELGIKDQLLARLEKEGKL